MRHSFAGQWFVLVKEKRQAVNPWRSFTGKAATADKPVTIRLSPPVATALGVHHPEEDLRWLDRRTSRLAQPQLVSVSTADSAASVTFTDSTHVDDFMLKTTQDFGSSLKAERFFLLRYEGQEPEKEVSIVRIFREGDASPRATDATRTAKRQRGQQPAEVCNHVVLVPALVFASG